jgi:molybdopterin converting factor small subunit
VIRVKVKYIPELIKSITGTSEEEITLGEDATLRSLLETIARTHGEKLEEWIFNSKRELSGNILLVVNGEITFNLERKLQDKDTVVLTIPFNGG